MRVRLGLSCARMQTTATEDPRPPPRWLAAFRRITTSGAFIGEVDGLRFIAIGTVVLFHLAVALGMKSPQSYSRPQGALAALAWNGYHGVELFFVISGFILAVPFASQRLLGARPVDLKSYFLRRLTRLEPPYVLCMVLFFLLLVTARGRSASELGPHLVAGIAYLHNLVYGYENPVNNVAWSLEVEVQFYLLTPLLAGVFAIRSKSWRRIAIVAAGVASAGLAWLFIAPGQRAYYSIARFLQFFLAGYLLADVFLTDWRERPAASPAWDLASLAGWPVLVSMWSLTPPGEREPLFVAVGYPALVFVLYCAAFRGRWTRWLLRQPLITTIGGMCYTIYLLHNPILGAAVSLTKEVAPAGSYALNLAIQLCLTAPLVLLCSAAYFMLIEKPCMRRDWPSRLASRLQSWRVALGVR